jgi:hypothetical protein
MYAFPAARYSMSAAMEDPKAPNAISAEKYPAGAPDLRSGLTKVRTAKEMSGRSSAIVAGWVMRYPCMAEGSLASTDAHWR